MNGTILSLKETYLKELIDYCSSSLVGKVMKRFEVLDDTDPKKRDNREAWFRQVIKREAKELIYEEFRQLRDLIIAHNKGLDITIFNFKRPDTTVSK